MTDTTQAAPTARTRVAAGAAWLDRNVPDWVGRIDLDELMMRSVCDCVLGQLFGDYYAAPITLDDSIAMGFDTAEGKALQRFAELSDAEVLAALERMSAEFAALASEWWSLIEARRARTADRETACCPCLGPVCDPGCTCPSRECPKTEAEQLG